MFTTRIAVATALVAAALPSTAGAFQDLRSPDARDAAARATLGLDAAAAAVAARPTLAEKLALARSATAKYATNLKRAKADGYRIITRSIPNMGYHFLNPEVQGFDVRRPAILVYVRDDRDWQLGALEWVFPERPAEPPIEGAQYGSFGAACHYVDGTFVFAGAEAECAPRSPESGARFSFWHPDLVTLHIWLWYPNPDGLYASENPLVAPFNEG
jgi:hypothetical protein